MFITLITLLMLANQLVEPASKPATPEETLIELHRTVKLENLAK